MEDHPYDPPAILRELTPNSPNLHEALQRLCTGLELTGSAPRCLELYAPRLFVPALCRILSDENADDDLIGMAARASSCFLEVSSTSGEIFAEHPESLRTICDKFTYCDLSTRTSLDLAEHTLQMLEQLSQQQLRLIHEQAITSTVLNFVKDHFVRLHRDSVLCGLAVVIRLCNRVDDADPEREFIVASLEELLDHPDDEVSECAVQCYFALSSCYLRNDNDPLVLFAGNLLSKLIAIMLTASSEEPASADLLSIAIRIISNICRGSAEFTAILPQTAHFYEALKAVLLFSDEEVLGDALRFLELFMRLVCDGQAIPVPVKTNDFPSSSIAELQSSIDAKNLKRMIATIKNFKIDPNATVFHDGHTVLNYASYRGNYEQVKWLLRNGADVDRGRRSSSLNLAAEHGKHQIVQLLLEYDADATRLDEDGKTALDRVEDKRVPTHEDCMTTIIKHKNLWKRIPSKPASSDNDPEFDSLVKRDVFYALLPIICEAFQATLLPNAQKILMLQMRKIVERLEMFRPDGVPEPEVNLCHLDFADRFMEVALNVLQHGIMVRKVDVFKILSSLLRMDQDEWVGHLQRYGVHTLIMSMRNPRGLFLQEILATAKLCLQASDARRPSALSPSLKPARLRPLFYTDAAMTKELGAEALQRAQEAHEAPVAEHAPIDEPGAPSPSAMELGHESDASRDTAPICDVADQVDDMAEAPAASDAPQPIEQHENSSSPLSIVMAAMPPNAMQSFADIMPDDRRQPDSDDFEDGEEEDLMHMEFETKSAYRWRNWFIVRDHSSLFIWNDVMLIELPFKSVGDFRYLANDDFHIQFTSGAAFPICVQDQDHNSWRKRKTLDMIGRWYVSQKRLVETCEKMPVRVLKFAHTEKKATAGVWELQCSFTTMHTFPDGGSTDDEPPKSFSLQIRHRNADASLSLMSLRVIDDSGGFVWHSGTGRIYRMMPDTLLPSAFKTGWCNGDSRRMKFFREMIDRRIVEKLAETFWTEFLKFHMNKDRREFVQLEQIKMTLTTAIIEMGIDKSAISYSFLDITRYARLRKSLNLFADFLNDHRKMSDHEFVSSGIMPVLSQFLVKLKKHPFAFAIGASVRALSGVMSTLVRRVLEILETKERFAEFRFESISGLEVHYPDVKARMKMVGDHAYLVDRTDKMFVWHPLAKVGALFEHLYKYVVVDWFEWERKDMQYVKDLLKLREQNQTLSFRHTSDFDENGIVYFVGTNGLHSPTFTDRLTVRAINVTPSPLGKPFHHGVGADILNRRVENCHTFEAPNCHITIDMGLWIRPTSYSLRHSRGFHKSALRNWLFQGSADNVKFVTLLTHTDDRSLTSAGSTATWHLPDTDVAYRYFRIQLNGVNDGGDHIISCSGFEIYGDVTDVVTDEIVPTRLTKEQRYEVKRKRVLDQLPHGLQNNMFKYGLTMKEVMRLVLTRTRMKPVEESMSLVVRGTNWMWNDQDGGEGQRGRLTRQPDNGWATVVWDNGYSNTYRLNFDKQSDIKRITETGDRLPPNEKNTLPQQTYKISEIFGELAENSEFLTREVIAKRMRKICARKLKTGFETALSSQGFVQRPFQSVRLKRRASTPEDGSTKAPSVKRRPSCSQSPPSEETQSSSLSSISSLMQRCGSAKEMEVGGEEAEKSADPDRTLTPSGQAHRSSSGEEEQPEEHQDAPIVVQQLAGAGGDPDDGDGDDEGGDDDDEDENDNGGVNDDLDEDFHRAQISRFDFPAFHPQAGSVSSDEPAPTGLPACLEGKTPEEIQQWKDEEFNAALEALQDNGVIVPLMSTLFGHEVRKVGDTLQIAYVFMPDVPASVDNSSGSEKSVELSEDVLDRVDEQIFNVRRQLRHARDMMITTGQQMSSQISKDPRLVKIPALNVSYDSMNTEIYEESRSVYRSNASRQMINGIRPVEDAVRKVRRLRKDTAQMKLRLFLRGPNMEGIENVTVEMSDMSASLLKYMHLLVHRVDWGKNHGLTRMLLSFKYDVLYCSADHEHNLRLLNPFNEEADNPREVEECLQLLEVLSNIEQHLRGVSVEKSEFRSFQLDGKLRGMLADSTVVTGNVFPKWCSRLIVQIPSLFHYETRFPYMQATSFGQGRAAHYMNNGQYPGLNFLAEETFSVRRVDILEQAKMLMEFNGEKKTILEVLFGGEYGIGSGVTMEFYGLVAAELQAKSLRMWMCDDLNGEEDVDLGSGKKPAGYYVFRPGGLFPEPLPEDSEHIESVCDLFRFLGTFLAKATMDKRLINLPLSIPFLKLLTDPRVSGANGVELQDVLDIDDLDVVDPSRGFVLKPLNDYWLDECQKAIASRVAKGCCLEYPLDPFVEPPVVIHGAECQVTDLGLNFSVNPSSRIFGSHDIELVPGGSDMIVDYKELGRYLAKCKEWFLNKGIVRQIRAFREGFERVCPLRSFNVFSPEELQKILFGEPCPEWTREDLIHFIRLEKGYTKESPGFLLLVEVLETMTARERKSFLQFVTGCSSLPPGGLAHLSPRLTVEKENNFTDGGYPTVNTCTHCMRLPEYSSAEILRERLLTAISQKEFHLA